MAKGYHHNNLLSFMLETMQNVVVSNIRDEVLGHVPYIYNNQAIYQVRPRKLQCTNHVITHIQEGLENEK